MSDLRRQCPRGRGEKAEMQKGGKNNKKWGIGGEWVIRWNSLNLAIFYEGRMADKVGIGKEL
jgi:hypothetical protein